MKNIPLIHILDPYPVHLEWLVTWNTANNPYFRITVEDELCHWKVLRDTIKMVTS